MRKWIGLIVVSCLASAPAEAGWSFKQAMRHTGGRGAENANTVTLVQMESGDARIDFVEAMDNPMFGKGSYILVRGNAPKGMFMVNTEKKTYSKFDPEGMSQAMSPMMNTGEGSGMQMKVSDAKLERLLEEPGEPMLGRATMHYRYRKSYVMTMEMANMKMPTAHDIVEDLWVTSAVDLGAGGFGQVMANFGGGGMMGEIAKLGELERQKQQGGFPLKSVTVDHSTPQGKGMMAKMMGGKEQTMTTTMDVSELEEKSLPATLFAIPEGYSEVDLMQPGAKAPNLEDEN